MRLGTERARADDELAKSLAAADHAADRVVRKARRRATAVLRVGRAREDDAFRARGASRPERDVVGRERARADERLRKEHALADRSVADERTQRARIGVALFRRERRQTDEGLHLERRTADEVVSRRDEFLGIVSHELRNDLTGIALNIAQILQALPDDEVGRRMARWAANIQRTNLRMSRVLGDLMDFASIEAGRLEIAPAEDDLRRVVENVVESFQPAAAARGISLNVRQPPESAPLSFDAQRIHQVLANLLTNALRFAPEGGEVSVRVETKRQETHLAVCDNGPGIPADRLEAIFERFTQGARPNRRGLGLGLYIAKRIVEAHGGRIWAESSPRRGATFLFTLPLPRSTGPRTARPSSGGAARLIRTAAR